jgi:5'-nucleotidase
MSVREMAGEPRRAIRRSLLIIGISLLPGAALAASAAPACEPRALNVLLTNDDGFDTPGIEALHRSLAAAGHRVKRIAPAENHSGGSAALSIRPVAVATVPSDEFTHVYSVDASPATTVLVGAAAFFGADEPLDLVISGINEGANLGPATPISGTVGATIVALQLLEPQVPAIAVSTNALDDDWRSEANLALTGRVADFVAALVRDLQQAHCAERQVLPPGVALNVNYPPLPPEQIKGVRWATQSRVKSFGLTYAPAGEGVFAPAMSRAGGGVAAPDGDTELFAQGYVTIVPLDGDYSVAVERLPSLGGILP